MADQQLHILAHGASGLALEGSSDHLHIAVCVTRLDGTPVTGLTKTKFKVRSLITAGTHVGSSIVLFNEADQPSLSGYYTLSVKPEATQSGWVIGDYVFAVTVQVPLRGGLTGKGRTLATVTVRRWPTFG